MLTNHMAVIAGMPAIILFSIITSCVHGIPSNTAKQGYGASPSEATPYRDGNYVDPAKTVYWENVLIREAEDIDSVWYRMSLINHSDAQLRFNLAMIPPLLEVRLLSSNGTVNKRSILLDHVSQMNYIRTPEYRKSMLDIVIDLKAVFGHIEPGKYIVDAILPRQSYTVEGIDNWTTGDMRCTNMNLAINKHDQRKASSEALKLPVWIEMVVDGKGYTGDAIIKNATNSDILIPITRVANKAEEKPLLSCVLTRWGHKYGWYMADIPGTVYYKYGDPNGIYYRTVPAGQDVMVTLPGMKSRGDGLYMYYASIGYEIEKHPATKAVRSEMFYVKNGKIERPKPTTQPSTGKSGD